MRRVIRCALMVGLLALAGCDPNASGLTSRQGDAILTELREIKELLKDRGQAARAAAPQPAVPAQQRAPSKVMVESAYSLGAPDAPVVLVEFVDLQCPFCRRFHLQTFDEIRNRYIKTGKVRYVVKDLPLPIHPQAMAAAVATRCAGIVGKDEGYWKMFEALFANGAMLSEAVIVSLSDDLGFDRKAFSECRSDRNVAQLIENDAAEATKLGITGTPTFVIAQAASKEVTGERIIGAQPLAAFTTPIDELLKGSK